MVDDIDDESGFGFGLSTKACGLEFEAKDNDDGCRPVGCKGDDKYEWGEMQGSVFVAVFGVMCGRREVCRGDASFSLLFCT